MSSFSYENTTSTRLSKQTVEEIGCGNGRGWPIELEAVEENRTTDGVVV